jgi:hypothetical protein
MIFLKIFYENILQKLRPGIKYSKNRFLKKKKIFLSQIKIFDNNITIISIFLINKRELSKH